MPGEITHLDAIAQASLVHSGQASAAELVEAAIAEVERWNPSLRAVVSDCYELAVESAQRTGREMPFSGVPLLVKDNHDCAGLPTRAASRYRAGVKPAAADHPVVSRLRAAGFIPLGKTNMPELGLLATTEPELYGPCGNPWAPQRTAGGSSGGSAAAVAAGLVPVATASDGGGSIRIPASACGAFGLKPSRGRTPGSAWGGLSVNGVITRSVRDSACLLDVLAAPGGDNPGSLPLPPAGSFSEAADSDPPRLRIGLCAGFVPGTHYEPEVWEAVIDTARLLGDLGHTVEEADIDLMRGRFGQVCDNADDIVSAAIARQLEIWEASTGIPASEDLFEPATWWHAEAGRKLTATALLAGYEALAEAARQVAPVFSRFDLLLLPTLAEPAPRNGVWQFPPEDPMRGWQRMYQFVPRFTTQLANYLGHPAMTVPLHSSSDGLPIGSQFYGRYGDEATLLSVAAALERARPWSARFPQLPARPQAPAC